MVRHFNSESDFLGHRLLPICIQRYGQKYCQALMFTHPMTGFDRGLEAGGAKAIRTCPEGGRPVCFCASDERGRVSEP